MNFYRIQRGFTLLEVLIALLVFTLGLIGMAALLVVSIKTNHSAYLRTQASFLAQSMADRMRSNPQAVWGDLYNQTYPTLETLDPCAGGAACSFAQVATRDRVMWNAELSDQLPGVAGDIACVKNAGVPVANVSANPPYNGLCTMHVSWNESSLNIGSADGTQTFAWVFQP